MSARLRFPAVLLGALLLTLCLPAATAAGNPAPGQEYPPGYIQLTTTPSGAEVFVNGTKMNGTTPFTVKVPSMLPQEVVVVKYGYEPDRRIVTAPPNGTIPLELTLRPIDGQGGTVQGTAGGRTTPASGPAGTWEEAPLSPAAALVALLLLGLVVAARRR